MKIKGVMSVDLEEYFHVDAFSNTIVKKNWSNYQSRVEQSVDIILDIFEKYNVKATFFTLSSLLSYKFLLIKKIAQKGHEIASHGVYHDKIFTLSKKALKEDIIKSKNQLEDCIGKEVLGYRAPCFSLFMDNRYAYELLANAGYLYSSSSYPITHDVYSAPNAPRKKYKAQDLLDEYPLTSAKIFKYNLPAAGGGYFRLLPSCIFNYLQKKAFEQLGYVIFYFHPWEIDYMQPKIKNLPYKSRVRHYVNLKTMQKKLIANIKNVEYTNFKEFFYHNKLTKKGKL